MKKITLFTLIFTLLFSVFAINAYAENDADLSIAYEYTNTNDVIVTAGVTNIKIEGGIYLIGYEITYDPAVFELTSSTVNIPEKWQPLVGDEEGPETDMSRLIEDGKYYWCTYIFKENYGITEDNQLTVTLQFKPLTNGNCDIKFTCTDISGYDLDITDYSAADKTVNIPFKNDNNGDIPVDSNTSNLTPPDASVDNEESSTQQDSDAESVVPENNSATDNSVQSSTSDDKETGSSTSDEATLDNIVPMNPTHKTIGIIATVIMGILIAAGVVYFIAKRKEMITLVKENSGVIVKFWLTHIVMSILGIMVGLALLVLEGEAEGISLIAIVGSAFTIGFMCFMHYDDMYFIAVKEGIKNRAENKKTDIYKGLKLTLISYSPVILIGFLAIIFTTFASEIENTSVVPMLLYYIFQGSFLGLYKIHTYLGVATYVIITLLPAIIAGALAYALGIKDKTLRGVLGMDVKPPYDGPVEKKNKNNK